MLKDFAENLKVINCINQETLEDLKLFLSRTGFHTFELNGKEIIDVASFFVEVVRVFPQDPPLTMQGGYVWDALMDSLWGGLREFGKERVAVIWTHTEKLLNENPVDLVMAVEWGSYFFKNA
jgi:hypothetical protein